LKRIVCVAVFVVACGAPSPKSTETRERAEPAATASQAPPAPATDGAPAEPERAPVVAGRNVYIDEVIVANPVVVRGRARTFENSVALRVRSADGRIVATGFTTSRGEMGRHNPFQGTLWLTSDPGSAVTVEALEYSAKDGSEQSLARLEKKFAVEAIRPKLYFPDEACTAVRPFVRRMPKSVSMARLLVEALVGGPGRSERAAGASTPFPEGSGVQSVVLRDGVITVDFNDRLRNVGGSCRAEMIRESVTSTLMALPSVRRVVITAAGSEPLALQP
jgi:hypothetical protein